MKHCCNNCAQMKYDLAEFGIIFKCGRKPIDLNMGCMDWEPFPPKGDKRVLIEVYRALDRGEVERAIRMISRHLDQYHEGAAFWRTVKEVPKNE